MCPVGHSLLSVHPLQTPGQLTEMETLVCVGVVFTCAYESPVKPHTVTSHSFAKTAATYVLLLRDVLLCALPFLPASSGGHARAA